MVRSKIIILTLSCLILMCSGIAQAKPGHGGGNSNNWWDVARGIGWLNSKLTGTWQPKGPKDGKVRTGLGSFRNNLNPPPPRKDPIREGRKIKHSKKPLKPAKTAPAKPKHKTKSKSKSNGVHTPKELKNLKPPPGVRAIRRVPTRIRR